MSDTREFRLAPLGDWQVLEAGKWRNRHRSGLRTPGFQTEQQQASFYQDVVCNPASPHRYFGVEFLAKKPNTWTYHAMVGLTYISWENGSAEISLITSGRGGVGRAAVSLILGEAFYRMRLLTVYGECYFSNPALGFWDKMVEEFNGASVVLPRRKFWDGELCNSRYFYFAQETWK